uniref:hypothetical protein n=1 Tax=Klebsiella pneumoniae TaxID=573 RepID=UPI0019548CBE
VQESRSIPPEKRHIPGGFWAFRLISINQFKPDKFATPGGWQVALDLAPRLNHKCNHENVVRNDYYLSDYYQL